MRVTAELSQPGPLTVTVVGHRSQPPGRVADAVAGLVIDVLERQALPAVEPTAASQTPRTDPVETQTDLTPPEPTPPADAAPMAPERAAPAAVAPVSITEAPPPLAPGVLADQLCALVDDGLRIEQAAARLGISRAKARKLYNGEVA